MSRLMEVSKICHLLANSVSQVKVDFVGILQTSCKF